MYVVSHVLQLTLSTLAIDIFNLQLSIMLKVIINRVIHSCISTARTNNQI